MPTWIDTHCHLDAAEFAPDVDAVRAAVRTAGVQHLVIPAVERANWEAVQTLAQRHGDSYALGIHPLYTGRAGDGDVAALGQFLQRVRHDPHLVAIGEIGLDYFAPGLDAARQEQFYRAQLQLARRFDLPVILHVRRAVDAVLKQVRRIGVRGGIAHAFNGSRQQAQMFIDLGFRLGFGGAMSFAGSSRIRELARTLPLSAIVLETDAPDMAPAWGQGERNNPANLARYAALLADLRGISREEVIETTGRNLREVLGGWTPG